MRSLVLRPGERVESSDKVGTGIAVAGLALAILAFFGVTQFEQLAPDTKQSDGDSRACDIFGKAIQEGVDRLKAYGAPAATRLYASDLRRAIQIANDESLRAALLDSATAAEYEADVREDPERQDRVNAAIAIDADKTNKLGFACNDVRSKQ